VFAIAGGVQIHVHIEPPRINQGNHHPPTCVPASINVPPEAQRILEELLIGQSRAEGNSTGDVPQPEVVLQEDLNGRPPPVESRHTASEPRKLEEALADAASSRCEAGEGLSLEAQRELVGLLEEISAARARIDHEEAMSKAASLEGHLVAHGHTIPGKLQKLIFTELARIELLHHERAKDAGEVYDLTRFRAFLEKARHAN